MEKKFMKEAMKQAIKACNRGEIPVGAVIVKDGKVIARGYNKKEKTKDVTKHAEIIAIQKACKKNNDWRLSGCSLYVTLEPCLMCMGALLEARIDKLVFGAVSENKNSEKANNKSLEIIGGVLEKENSEILKKFFQKKR
ncbi:MAG: nucleoside deaminase [Bacilli bacterium]|jgi:tRNA(adenine34) deaminase|nr:nucleoside deaminase [Bacilli bacterium]